MTSPSIWSPSALWKRRVWLVFVGVAVLIIATTKLAVEPYVTAPKGLGLPAQATALAICAHTSPPCGPCAREIKIAPFHTWGYEGRPWTSNDCAQASHTEKNARAHDFSQKRCDAYDRSRPPVNAARTHFAPRDSCRPYIQHVRCASITYNTV